MLKLNEIFKLNAHNIDIISENTDKVCQSLNLNSDQRIRIRLFVEEVLIDWLEKNNEEIEIELRSGTRFFKPVIILSYAAPKANNPLKEDEYGVFLKSVFEQLTFAPEYTYERGKNTITIKLKKPEPNPINKILMIMAFSLCFGLVGKMVIPQDVITILQEYIVVPTYEKFLDVLGCIAGPLIFFSVTWGIYGIGDTATLNRLGKGMLISYLRDVLIAVVFCVVFFPVFGCVISGGRVDYIQIMSIYTMFLDMLPVTIVEPFATGNTVQIIILAIIVGITLLCLGKKTRYVAVAVEQINLITNFLMETISKFVPFFIVLVLINMVWSDTINTLIDSWRFVLYLLIALVVTGFIYVILSSINNRVKISLLLKKSLPSYLVALTTASSAASFGTLVKNCEKEFGISDSLTSFGIPLGIVMHKVASAINCILIAFYVAGLYKIETSLSWIMMAVIISFITAIATPPIPGGAVIGYSMLFMQLGLPEEGLAIVLAIDVITDFLITSTDIFCLPMALLGVAKRYDLLDVDKLRESNAK